jgi:hypothetical protein
MQTTHQKQNYVLLGGLRSNNGLIVFSTLTSILSLGEGEEEKNGMYLQVPVE